MQRAVTNYDGWRFTGLLISISEIDFLKPDYRSFAIASRRRRCPRDFANSHRKELDISSVLFGKAFLKPKCKNQSKCKDQIGQTTFVTFSHFRSFGGKNFVETLGLTFKIAVKILKLHLQTRQVFTRPFFFRGLISFAIVLLSVSLLQPF